MGGVVMGHDDDRALGVRLSELAEHVMAAARGEHSAKPPAPRRQLIGDQRRRSRTRGGGDRPLQWASRSGGEARERAGAGQQADWPPERSVRLGLLLDTDVTDALFAQGDVLTGALGWAL